MSKKDEKKWFLRSMFMSITHQKSTQQIRQANKNLIVRLTPNEVTSIEQILNIKLSNEQISAINRFIKDSYLYERDEAYSVGKKPFFSKADAALKGISQVCKVNIGPIQEKDISDSIQSSLSMKERNEIIEKNAKSARFRTGIASLAFVSFLSGAGATKALTDSYENASNKYASSVEVNVDDYGMYVDKEGNEVEQGDGEYTIDEVDINNLTEKNEDGSKSFRSSLVVDGVEVDENEITVTESIEKAVESAMNSINSKEDVLSYTESVVSAEYNDVTNSNISVTSFSQGSESGSVYVDDNNVLRISKDNDEKSFAVTYIRTVDKDGNTEILKYVRVEDEYVRAYSEDEESQGDQTLNKDIIDLIEEAILWNEEYNNTSTMFTIDENGREVTRTDEDGNEVHASDLIKEDYKTKLTEYKTRKVQEEIEEDYIQDNDSDER